MSAQSPDIFKTFVYTRRQDVFGLYCILCAEGNSLCSRLHHFPRNPRSTARILIYLSAVFPQLRHNLAVTQNNKQKQNKKVNPFVLLFVENPFVSDVKWYHISCITHSICWCGPAAQPAVLYILVGALFLWICQLTKGSRLHGRILKHVVAADWS